MPSDKDDPWFLQEIRSQGVVSIYTKRPQPYLHSVDNVLNDVETSYEPGNVVTIMS